MIHVVASIRVKADRRSEFLKILKSNMPSVREEKGCIEYSATVDIDADHPIQSLDERVVTIVEKWESIAALHDHFKTPHMIDYVDKVKELVEERSVKVLTDA